MVSEILIFIKFYWCFYSRSSFSETEGRGEGGERERERERWQNCLERRLDGHTQMENTEVVIIFMRSETERERELTWSILHKKIIRHGRIYG